tara:strand:+ start:43 stop:321 length:279 start_codon:yes stop_codon:yes gene_type:complete
MKHTARIVLTALSLSISPFFASSAQAETGSQDAPSGATKEWALLIDGIREQASLPELMTEEVCYEIGKSVKNAWRSSFLCANVNTGEVRGLR